MRAPRARILRLLEDAITMTTMSARLATFGALCVTFVAGYVWGTAGTPPAGAQPPADRLAMLEANQETLRRAWNASREATLRGLRLEPDPAGRYLVVGTGSPASSERALDVAGTDADNAYQRSVQPTSSTP
jgi:hypothetical protein